MHLKRIGFAVAMCLASTAVATAQATPANGRYMSGACTTEDTDRVARWNQQTLTFWESSCTMTPQGALRDDAGNQGYTWSAQCSGEGMEWTSSMKIYVLAGGAVMRIEMDGFTQDYASCHS